MALAISLLKNCIKCFLLLFIVFFGQKLIAQPVINSFSPASGEIGTSVVINGNNFSTTTSNNIVYFGAVKAVVTAASLRSLTATVPAGATYQPITVTTSGLTAYSATPFKVTFTWTNTINDLLAAKIDLTTGLHPNDLVLADLDGDGWSDLATANNFNTNNGPASISILKNISASGKISFAQKMEIPVGAMAYSINAGDLNGDGKLDLVVSSIVNKTISVLINTSSAGNISFASEIEYVTGDDPYSIVIADLNKDGKPDIAVANYLSNTVSVFKNTSGGGTISFAEKIDLITALAPYRLIATDIDGDGSFDLAVTNNLSNTISVFRNTGSGGSISFAPKIDYPAGRQPQGISTGDLDGDGKAELVVANYLDGTVSVFKNNSTPGNASFSTGSPIIFPNSNVQNVSLGDLNGDGMPEVVVPAVDNNIYLNVMYVVQNTSSTGAISFGTNLKYYALSPFATVLGDLDNDGKTDIAEANFSNSSVSVFRNQLTDPVITSFTPTTGVSGTIDTIRGANFIGVTKVAFGGMAAKSFNILNSTTIIAVVDSGRSGKVSVTTLNGTGALDGFVFAGPPAISSFTPTKGTSGSTLIIAGSNLVGATDISIGGIPATSFIVVNADTVMANVGAGASGNIAVQTNFGVATASGFDFVPPPQIISFSPTSGPLGTTVDITGTNFSSVKDSDAIYFGSVKGIVTTATNSSVNVTVPKGAGYEPFSFYTGQSHFPVYSGLPFNVTFPGTAINFTDNSFGKKIDINSGFTSGAFTPRGDFVTGDLDGDGKNDMAIIGIKNYAYQLSIFKNNSAVDSVAFTGVADYSLSPIPTRIAMCDIDNDGKKDILIANQGGYFTVFRNSSSDGKISFVQYSFNSYGPIFGIAARDLDGDGKAEVVVTSSAGNVVVHRNTSIGGNISFTEPILVSLGGSYDSRLLIADLNNDGKAEIILASGVSNVIIFKNKCTAGTILFDGGTGFAAGYRPSSLAIGDIDGDSMPDIVATDLAGSTLYVLKNGSSGDTVAFEVFSFTYGQQVYPITLSDLDGDGKPDIIAEASSSFLVMKNTTSGGVISFANEVSYPSVQAIDPGVGEIASSDIDLDGKPDVIEVRVDSVSVFRNRSNEPKVTPAGVSPVAGPVITKITIDPTVQVFNGSPYVQRHYDIEPTTNTSTATAIVTLYFTQKDFDNFNAFPGHGFDLPKYPGDSEGIANVRVYQYHGFSATGKPGSYSGKGVVIDPGDNDIIWNAGTQNWEVSFNVTGFSGFFLSSAGNDALPLHLISFTGTVTGNVSNIKWITTNNEDLAYIQLDRSTDSRVFETIKIVKAVKSSKPEFYQYNDTLLNYGVYYYRLRVIDKNDVPENSRIIIIKINSGPRGIKVIPDPAKDLILIEHPVSSNSSQLELVDASGKIVKRVSVEPNGQATKLNVHGLAAGMYHIRWVAGKISLSGAFMILK